MEAELTRSSKKTSNNDSFAVAEGANVDEAVTAEAKAINNMEIDPKEEQKIQSYKETMKIDIENINTFENINKVYTTQWRKIYEVI